MRQSIHHHYEQLTQKERHFVDDVFDAKRLYELASQMGIPLAGDDRVERAVDALARAVIESRPKPVELPPAPKLDVKPDADPPMDGVMETHLALKGAGLL